jgi:hypothetical protein
MERWHLERSVNEMVWLVARELQRPESFRRMEGSPQGWVPGQERFVSAIAAV